MSRKLLVTLILILFLLPFISWYYLQRGLTYRKDAQQIMNGTQPFPEGEWIDVTEKKFSSQLLDGRVSLITILPCDKISDFSTLLDQFYDQFKETQKATFIIIDTCNATAQIQYPDREQWFVFSCSYSLNLCSSLLPLWSKDKSHALVDRKKVIRSFYNSTNQDEKRLLLEHMALLIPRERSEKVELKRGSQK